jgi:putative Holliday junction resolvase
MMRAVAERGRMLAIDWGDRRIGLAVSDPTGTVASPAGFIPRRLGKRAPIAELVRRAGELAVVGVVFGLPLDEDGNDTPRTVEVRRVGAELAKRTGLPVRYVDERYTTTIALRTVRELGGSTRRRKGDVDALAAAVLLQHALALPE